MSITTGCRAEVVGSMLRPEPLHRAKTALAAGTISVAEFKFIEDRAVDQAIAVQEAAGVDVVTDGEFRRGVFTGPLTESITGYEYVPGVTRNWYTDEGPIEEELPLVITGKLTSLRSMVTEEYTYARARATRPVKATVPSPLMTFLRWSPRHAPSEYRDAFEMAADAVRIVKSEIRELTALGCQYVQIDAPEIATLVQQETRDWYEKQGIPTDRMLSEGLDLINSVTDIPGPTYGIHLCRGNSAGRWMASGGYDHIAEALFRRGTGFDRFLLEYDDQRSGSFAPLAAAPDGKMVVLGLVSSKKAAVETVEELEKRVKEAANVLPLELLAISTQCGFASVASGNPDVSEKIQAAKLSVVAETARALWND
ncbi:MAG: methionine synthase [Pseudonocardiaceae bacterium]|nr:methionine synthase [Pseudonocardiaceae bacterium]